MNRLRIFILGLFMAATTASTAWADGDQVIKLLRSFFDEDSSAPLKVSKALSEEPVVKTSKLSELAGLQFAPKDIWGNRDYVFGYGTLADGSVVLFGWKNTSDSPRISLKDLSGIYEDDRMASIQDEKDLKRWKKMREIVAGAFIGVRKSESKFTALYPIHESLDAKTGRASLSELQIDKEPIVIKFSPIRSNEKSTRNLLSSVDRVR